MTRFRMPRTQARRRVGRPTVALLGVAAAALALVAGAQAATAAPTRSVTLYASPSGSSNNCAVYRPCTLATAQGQARTYSRAGYTVAVLLAGGTYSLTSPLSLTSADSGLTGHRVTYQAESGQKPVLSGGRTISGWKVYSAAKNIYVASAAGITATRQLYVNGRRATPASAPVSSVFGTLTPTSTGYTAAQSTGLASWTGAADEPDLVYPGAPFPWTWSMCPIAAATSATSAAPATLTMADPCFANLTTPMTGYSVDSSTLAGAAYVENNLALLTQPGQFYVDTHDGLVYYIPRTGESMSSATVVAPQLTSLLTATGVANLTIAGIGFQYATWLPSQTQGVVDIQSNLVDTSSNASWSMLPSAVTFTGASNVVFAVNTLAHLGGAGVDFEAGGSGNAITGNVVTDVSGTGISVASPLAAPETDDIVNDNYVNHVALEYQGGVGVFVGITAHTTIAHNEVWAVPGTGISLGWGWGTSTSMTDNHVDYNRVHDVNESSQFDGGAIYVNGAESGAAENSSVVGNYVSGDPQPYGAIYLESGASNYLVSSNVVAHTGANWIYLQTAQYGDPAVDNTITGNYTDAGASTQCTALSALCPKSATTDSSNSLSDNATSVSSWPTTASLIIAAAGIESAYSSITGGTVDTDVAYGTTATGSSTDLLSRAAAAANDGDSHTAWTSAAGSAPAIWQTDLGSAKTLSEIQVLTNQASDMPASRANLQVVVSNSPITATATGTTACTIGATGAAFQGSLDCTAPTGTWRYVGIIGTAGQQLSLAEVRVFGH